MSEEHDKPGFRVTDHRRFTDEGDARTLDDAPGHGGAAADAVGADAPVSFSTFVLGLSTQALLHLGEIESPLSGKIERDLAAAKHVIDILGILRDKTRNNLEQAEEAMLDSILYDLRMRYVDLVRAAKKEEA
jgi:Domain of unknown function (DUF1844)